MALFIALVLLLLGFAVPLWPLTVTGLLLLGVSGYSALTLFVGVMLDVAYGAPIGHLTFLYVPFTLLAVVTIVLRYYLSSYFRQSDSDHL